MRVYFTTSTLVIITLRADKRLYLCRSWTSLRNWVFKRYYLSNFVRPISIKLDIKKYSVNPKDLQEGYLDFRNRLLANVVYIYKLIRLAICCKDQLSLIYKVFSSQSASPATQLYLLKTLPNKWISNLMYIDDLLLK